jgi:hypothetical protein
MSDDVVSDTVPGPALAQTAELKQDLLGYLRKGREMLVWKLEGLSEYDIRRPLVPTGTNLLGLVKHLAAVEAGYFGAVFARPFPEPIPWLGSGAEPNADLWATSTERPEQLIGLYRRVWAHADATIEALPLDAVGRVPWWPAERAQVSLHRILVNVTAEVYQHAGHADIVRELIDGAAGRSAANDNLWQPSTSWAEHRARLEEVANRFRGA